MYLNESNKLRKLHHLNNFQKCIKLKNTLQCYKSSMQCNSNIETRNQNDEPEKQFSWKISG